MNVRALLTSSVVSSTCLYLLVELRWSRENTSTVTDAGLTAADWDTVVPGLHELACVSPVRVVVNAATVQLKRKNATENLQSGC